MANLFQHIIIKPIFLGKSLEAAVSKLFYFFFGKSEMPTFTFLLGNGRSL